MLLIVYNKDNPIQVTDWGTMGIGSCGILSYSLGSDL